MKQLFVVIGLTLGLGIFGSCSKDEEFEKEKYYYPITLSESATRTGKTVDAFSYRLFHRQTTLTDENCVISPFCLSALLSMLANGADDEKRQQILEVLGLSTIEEVNDYYRQLISQLPKHTNEATVCIANSLWTPSSLTIGSEFTSIMGDVYDAEFHNTVPGDGSGNARLFNSWVREKTGGMIPHMFDYISDVALANAIYFNGEWLSEFDLEATKSRPFHNIDGTEGEVMMMECTGYYMAHVDDVYMVRLNMSGGYQAYFFDSDVKSINEIAEWLDNENFNRLHSGLEWHVGQLSMPKFKSEYKGDVKGLIDSMCEGNLWEGADSYPLIAPGISFNELTHGCVYNVDELGVTATAVATVATTICPGGDGFQLNQPFIYLIRIEEGPILFMGQKTRA